MLTDWELMSANTKRGATHAYATSVSTCAGVEAFDATVSCRVCGVCLCDDDVKLCSDWGGWFARRSPDHLLHCDPIRNKASVLVGLTHTAKHHTHLHTRERLQRQGRGA